MSDCVCEYCQNVKKPPTAACSRCAGYSEFQGNGTEHELKVWPPFFQGVIDGTKSFEIRKNDRNFALGDILYLREFNPELMRYSGRSTRRQVVYFLDSCSFAGIEKGYCVMGLGPVILH